MELYIIGKNNPLKHNEVKNIEQEIKISLPKDYKYFLESYGFGTINDFLFVTEPDKDFFRENFANHLDIWELKEDEKELITAGIKLAGTINGDYILHLNNIDFPFVIMPRHKLKPIYFKNFTKSLEYFINNFANQENLYFESSHDDEREIIKLDNTQIHKIHIFFTQNFSYDKCIKNEIIMEDKILSQPLYIIQEIGGWVRFDLIYQNSFSIKYQKKFKPQAKNIIERLKNIL